MESIKAEPKRDGFRANSPATTKERFPRFDSLVYHQSGVYSLDYIWLWARVLQGSEVQQVHSEEAFWPQC